MTRIDTSAPTIPGFMERLVPFYAHCLIEVSFVSTHGYLSNPICYTSAFVIELTFAGLVTGIEPLN